MKRILIYCRESRDDGFQNYERIETQAQMLISYAEKQNLGNIIKIVMDDNKTGTNFDRLIPIKEMILNKEFDIFLCKDCSRIGRNLLESLKFIEFLEKHSIELLFLTETYDEDIFPIKAWFNQLRVKDDSKKIKGVMKQKMIDGTLLIKAPFGYIKDGNSLVLDEKTSCTVLEIFNLFLDGYSKSEIAYILNEKNIKTPAMYKPEYNTINTKWDTQKVDRILKHRIYTGDMVYSRKEKKYFNSKVYTEKSEKDWIIYENHHTPIISREVFLEAQKKLKKNNIRKNRTNTNNIFSGILFCGNCGSTMYKKNRNGKIYYICKKYNLYGNTECSSHKILENDIIGLIFQYLNTELSKNETKLQVENLLKNNLNNENDIKNINSEINKLKQNLSILYDDKIENKIPEFLYLEKFESYQQKINNLHKKKEIIEQNKNLIDIHEIINNLTLTNAIIKKLFEKIIIYEKGDYSEFKTLTENGGVMFI